MHSCTSPVQFECYTPVLGYYWVAVTSKPVSLLPYHRVPKCSFQIAKFTTKSRYKPSFDECPKWVVLKWHWCSHWCVMNETVSHSFDQSSHFNHDDDTFEFSCEWSEMLWCLKLSHPVCNANLLIDDTNWWWLMSSIESYTVQITCHFVCWSKLTEPLGWANVCTSLSISRLWPIRPNLTCFTYLKHFPMFTSSRPFAKFESNDTGLSLLQILPYYFQKVFHTLVC